MDPRVTRVEETMRVIGGRWKPAIMFLLIRGGTHRFSELMRGVEGVSQRMLTKQLRDLQRHGLVERTFYEQIPPRVEYAATDLGKTLHRIYKSVCDWSEEAEKPISDAKRRYDRRASGLGRGPA